MTRTDPFRLASHALRIAAIDMADAAVASEVHAVHLAAYALEAALLRIDVAAFSPLWRTAADLQSDGALHVAAVLDGRIVAAAGVELAVEDHGTCIASFVVAPGFQRQGVGTRLLADVVGRYGIDDLAVETAAGNLPALSLYARFGFKEEARRVVGSAAIELVRLRRTAAP